MHLNGKSLIKEDLLVRKQYLDIFMSYTKDAKLDNPDQLNLGKFPVLTSFRLF